MSRLVLTDPKEDDTVAYISFSMIKYPQIARLLIAVHFITANLKRLIDLDYGVGVDLLPHERRLTMVYLSSWAKSGMESHV